MAEDVSPTSGTAPDTLYYQIVPSMVIEVLGEYFVPGKTYCVSKATYGLTLADGSTFSSKCKSFKPLSYHPG